MSTQIDLADGAFITYETINVSGMNKVSSALIEITADDVYQVAKAAELLFDKGLDDNVSVIIFAQAHLDGLLRGGN